jgi:hypothetical protein
MLVEKCIREVSWRYLREAGTHRQTISNIKFSRENIFEYGFLRSARMAAERDRDGSPVLLVDFESLFNDLYTTRPPRIVVSGSEPGATRTTSSLRFNFNKLAVGLSDRDQITATQVLEQSPRNR